MPPRGVKKGTKRARQYEHIEQVPRDHGRSEDTAEEIAAWTGSKERARLGEAEGVVTALPRGHLLGPARWAPLRPTRAARSHEDQLYEEARQRGIKGWSKMTKDELVRALGGRR